jgi:hypothetical protein
MVSAQIDQLWAEQRRLSGIVRHGSTDEIVRRARADKELERDLHERRKTARRRIREDRVRWPA